MSDAYRGRVLTALTWSASGEVAAQGLRFMVMIALARLLSPEEFGIMGMLMVIVNFLVNNADLGFEEALVQQQHISEAHRSSAFWLMLATALILAILLIVAAPWIAAFYGVPALRSLATLLSALFVLRALVAVPRAMITRALDFRVIALRRCVAMGVGGVVAIVLARLGFGVRSLAAETLIVVGLESLLLLHASEWRPRLELRWRAIRELAGFGAYRPATRILSYWSQRIDQLLIGKIFGSNPLGLYARAFNAAQVSTIGVSRVIVEVLFPSFAQLKDDPARMRSVYLRSTAVTAVAAVALCMGLAALSDPFIDSVLGPRWHDASPLLRILSLAGLFQSLTVFASSVYLAQGRPDLLLRLTLVQRLLMIVAIVVALRWGLRGIALAQVLAAVFSSLTTLYFAGTLIDLPFRIVAGPLVRIFAAGIVMAALVMLVDHLAAPHFISALRLLCGTIVGSIVYVAALRVMRVDALGEVVMLSRRVVTGTR